MASSVTVVSNASMITERPTKRAAVGNSKLGVERREVMPVVVLDIFAIASAADWIQQTAVIRLKNDLRSISEPFLPINTADESSGKQFQG
jgi:hypothetical protein